MRALLDGMNLEAYRNMQGEHDAMKKRVASLSLELQAARDKLSVYMRYGRRSRNLCAALLDG